MTERSLKRSHRRRVAAGAAGATAVGAFALAPTAQAANIQVDLTTDAAPDGVCTAAPSDCTLRDAVGIASANGEADTITFLSSLSGTIRLTAAGGGPIDVNDAPPNFPIAINGPGAGQLEISGDSDDDNTGNYRIFDVFDDSPLLTISGLTLTEGLATRGGAIQIGYPSGGLTLNNVTLRNNTANQEGGAVYQAFGTPPDERGPITVTNSTITGNQAGAEGGGLFTTGDLTIANTDLTGNTASGAGGGGGAFVTGKYGLDIRNATFSGNNANHGDGRGGGITVENDSKYAANLDITNTTIVNNSAEAHGAGLMVDDIDGGSRMRVSQTTISGNHGGAAASGGGIGFDDSIDGTFELLNSTVSGNDASIGGGIGFGSPNENALIDTAGEIEINNSTIARNTADAPRGGGIYLGQYTQGSSKVSGTILMNSTLVADNTAAGIRQDLDQADAATAGGIDVAFSLIERKGDARLIQSPPGSNVLGVDPKLKPLADNGGATRTHKFSASSRAVDRGDSSRLAIDQRGSKRIVRLGVPDARTGNGTDIGAVELRANEIPNDKCAGKPATIIGDSRVIRGTKGPDIISGTAGKNVIRGRGGRDVICGGKGRDRLIGGGGRDRLIGGPGRDRLIQ